MSTILLDERSAPSLRQILGAGLARASEADFAVAKIRIAGIDLGAGELSAIRTCRVLVGRLDVDSLLDGSVENRARIELLLRLIDNGRLHVRAAGLQSWYPDFSVLRGLAGGGALTLLGAHYFSRPYPVDGPALTCITTDRSHAAAATERFACLWQRGYDVSPVIRSALHRSLSGPG